MKKLLLLLITAVFTVSVIWMGIACKEEAAPATAEEEEKATAEEIVLEVWDWQAGCSINDAYPEIIANFEEDHPGVKVNYTTKTFGSYFTEIKAALSAGEAPDIFGVYPGTDVATMADEGSIADLKPYIMDDEEWLDWLGNTLDFGSIYYKDGIYILPTDRIDEAIWYWKDMAEEAGITEIPVTIDDYIALLPKAEAAGMQLMIAGFNEGPWVYMDTNSNFVHQQQEIGEEI